MAKRIASALDGYSTVEEYFSDFTARYDRYKLVIETTRFDDEEGGVVLDSFDTYMFDSFEDLRNYCTEHGGIVMSDDMEEVSHDYDSSTIIIFAEVANEYNAWFE